MTPVRLNDCLLPDSDYAKAAVELANKLVANKPKKFSIDNINYHPHVTLYTTFYSNKEIALDTVEKLAINFKPTLVNSIKTVSFANDGYFYIDFTPSRDNLMPLHRQVVDSLSEHLSDIGTTDLQKYSLPDQELIKQHGSRNVLEKFRPHLTLGEFLSVLPINTVKIPQELTSTILNNIAVATSGPYGTITEILKTFSLKP